MYSLYTVTALTASAARIPLPRGYVPETRSGWWLLESLARIIGAGPTRRNRSQLLTTAAPTRAASALYEAEARAQIRSRPGITVADGLPTANAENLLQLSRHCCRFSLLTQRNLAHHLIRVSPLKIEAPASTRRCRDSEIRFARGSLSDASIPWTFPSWRRCLEN